MKSYYTGSAVELAPCLLQLVTHDPLTFPTGISFACVDDCDPAVRDHVYGEFTPGLSVGRRTEFLRGRFAAAEALRNLDPTLGEVVGRGRAGEPLWPAGVCGAITHSRGIACAAVARTDRFAGLGIDLEPIAGPEEWPTMLERCSNQNEREWALAARGEEGMRTTVLYSIKEAIFKATFSAVGRFFDFSCVTVMPGESDLDMRVVGIDPEIRLWVSPETTTVAYKRYHDAVLSASWHAK